MILLKRIVALLLSGSLVSAHSARRVCLSRSPKRAVGSDRAPAAGSGREADS